MKLSAVEQRFVLHWGEMGSRWGVIRTVAQIHALLYLATAPLHAEEIAETLQARVHSARGQYYSAVTVVSEADLQAADLRYHQALAAVEDSRIERDNIGGQFGGDSNEWQVANARYGEATFNAEIARLQAESLRNGNGPAIRAALAGIEQAEAQLAQVLAGPTQAELDSAAIAIEQAENELERAGIDYSRTILTAPITGLVTNLNLEVGGLVAPNLSVIEITDIDPLG